MDYTFTIPLAKESLDIQRWMNNLNYSREDLKNKYNLSNLQMKNILLGKPTDADKGLFFNIHYDLSQANKAKKATDNRKAMGKLINHRKAFDNKLFYKLFRKLLDISQKELAELLDVSLPTIQSWEQGKSKAKGGNRILLFLLLPEEVKEQLDICTQTDSTDSPFLVNEESTAYQTETPGHNALDKNELAVISQIVKKLS